MATSLVLKEKLTLNPVILAAGTALFRDVQKRRNLKLIGTREFASGTVLLRYQPDPNP